MLIKKSIRSLSLLVLSLLLALSLVACGTTQSTDNASPEGSSPQVEAPTEEISETEPTSAPDDDDSANTTTLVSPIPGAECDTQTAPTGDPIVVGGSLALTGFLAPTANIHRVVGEVVTTWLNECGGLLGRPVEWQVLDDQSSADQATANYERLTTVDKVELVMGPYGGANILAGAGPVGKAGMIYVTHTNGAPQAEIGDYHFPSWQIGDGHKDVADIFDAATTPVWDALEASGTMPKTAFYASSKFPTTLALTAAARDGGEKLGIETLEYVEYDLGTTDFSAIALRISAAAPDFIYIGGIGLDATNFYDAFETIGYQPKGIYIALPSPGPTMALGDLAEGLMVLSIYENHAPFSSNPIATEFSKRFIAATEAEGLLSLIETQAAASFGAWQILTSAVYATNTTDNAELKSWLLEQEIETIAGPLNFKGFNGYGTDFNRVVQIQNGKRVVVWPPQFAPKGVKPIYPIN